jgi:uncharacterized protein YndB with AHSA1/START domain
LSSLTLVRRIAARPQIVFEALIEAQAIARWWGPDSGPVLLAETDARVGGQFRVRFRTVNGNEHEASGHYLEILRPTRLVMSWRWIAGGELDEAGEESRIEIDLRPIDGGTELIFTHARLKTEASRSSHERGWNGSLDKLEQYILEAPGPTAAVELA